MHEAATRVRRRFSAALASALFGIAACGGGSAAGGGQSQNASSPPASQSGGEPLAGRILCEAECRRNQRCASFQASRGGTSEDPRACFARCPTLPVRNPPVWSVPFVAGGVRCFDTSGCGTDEDEICFLQFVNSMPPTQSSDLCMRSITSGSWGNDARWCSLLAGLTPGADAATASCLQRGASTRDCEPPLDWK